jgi:hypothetical protein
MVSCPAFWVGDAGRGLEKRGLLQHAANYHDIRVCIADVELAELLGYLLDGGGHRGSRAYFGLPGYDFPACRL